MKYKNFKRLSSFAAKTASIQDEEIKQLIKKYPLKKEADTGSQTFILGEAKRRSQSIAKMCKQESTDIQDALVLKRREEADQTIRAREYHRVESLITELNFSNAANFNLFLNQKQEEYSDEQ